MAGLHIVISGPVARTRKNCNWTRLQPQTTGLPVAVGAQHSEVQLQSLRSHCVLQPVATNYNQLQPLLSTLGPGYHYHSTVFLEQGKVLEYKYYNTTSTVIYLVITVPHHRHVTAVYCIDATSITSVADTIELAFLHWHGWDGTWCGIDGGVVTIIAGCMQVCTLNFVSTVNPLLTYDNAATPTTSLKLYMTTNHPRDPTSRDPNHDDGSNKWHQRSLSNNYNTSSEVDHHNSGQGDNNNSKTWRGDNNNGQQDEVGSNNNKSTQESTTFDSVTQQLGR
ncbi:hypothetical protein EDB89DRAFT_1913717 [Lactarius sanguifluus]|nr:hypothetical protein EDB89DRAFT_1913717 [Lactarius sanguifluus]